MNLLTINRWDNQNEKTALQLKQSYIARRHLIQLIYVLKLSYILNTYLIHIYKSYIFSWLDGSGNNITWKDCCFGYTKRKILTFGVTSHKQQWSQKVKHYLVHIASDKCLGTLYGRLTWDWIVNSFHSASISSNNQSTAVFQTCGLNCPVQNCLAQYKLYKVKCYYCSNQYLSWKVNLWNYLQYK